MNFCPLKNCDHLMHLMNDDFTISQKNIPLPLNQDHIKNVKFCNNRGIAVYVRINDQENIDRNSKPLEKGFVTQLNYYDEFHYWKFEELDSTIEFMVSDFNLIHRKESNLINNTFNIKTFALSNKSMKNSFKCFDNYNDYLCQSNLDMPLAELNINNFQALYSFKEQLELENYLLNLKIMN